MKSGEVHGGKTVFDQSDNSIATTNLSSAEIGSIRRRTRRGRSRWRGRHCKVGGKEGRFVVVGSSSWIGNNILRFNGNRDLFLNMMNWLSSDEDLISIRPKEPEDRRADAVTGGRCRADLPVERDRSAADRDRSGGHDGVVEISAMKLSGLLVGRYRPGGAWRRGLLVEQEATRPTTSRPPTMRHPRS